MTKNRFFRFVVETTIAAVVSSHLSIILAPPPAVPECTDRPEVHFAHLSNSRQDETG